MPALGNTKLSDVTEADVRAALQAQFKAGKAIATIQLCHAVAHRLFDAAIDDGHITRNPTPPFKKLRLGKSHSSKAGAKRQSLSRAQADALLAMCDEPSAHLFAAIMRYNGLRPGEANGLRWADIDTDNLLIHVRGSAKKVYGAPGEKGRLWIGAPKTDSSANWVPMDPILVPLFQTERARQEAIQRDLRGLDAKVRELRSLLPKDACVFPSDPATLEGLSLPCEPASLRDRIAAAAGRAGLKGVTGHWLRHTFASIKLADGVPLPVVSRMLRHKHPGITAKIYAHALPGWEKDPSLFRQSPAILAAEPEQISTHKGQD